MIHRTALIGEPPEHRDCKDIIYQWHEPVLGVGVRINAYVTVDAGMKQPTRVGARTFLMTKTHVGHDAQIGADCELAPGAVIGGHVEVGDRVRVGINACLKPYVKVGDDARIGMGAVVTQDVPAGEVWVGNPARPLVKDRGQREAYEYYLSVAETPK